MKETETVDYLDLHSKVDKLIAKGKCLIIAVSGNDTTEPNFSYTIGLTSLGLPELVMTGLLSVDIMHHYVDSISDDLITGNLKPKSQMLKNYCKTVKGDFDMRLVELDINRRILHDEYAVQLFEHYRGSKKQIRLMQVYWPDTEGRFQDHNDWNCGTNITFISK